MSQLSKFKLHYERLENEDSMRHLRKHLKDKMIDIVNKVIDFMNRKVL